MTETLSTPQPIQGGASLIVAWQLKGRPLLVIGGGAVAERRVFYALEAEAKVTVISPEVVPELQHLIQTNSITYIKRHFNKDTDIDLKLLKTTEESALLNEIYPSCNHWAMVLSAIDDHETSKTIGEQCREHRIPVNVADVPEYCDFYFMSTYRDQSLQVAISSNGQGPRLARKIRQTIENSIPVGSGKAIENVGKLRGKIRKIDNKPESVETRMKWMSAVCDGLSISELANMTGEDIDRLVEEYPVVPEKVRQRIEGTGDVVDTTAGETTKSGTSEVASTSEGSTLPVASVNEGRSLPDEVPITSPAASIAFPLSPSTPPAPSSAKLLLVGAGPGSPDLLTLRALHALQSSDTIIADNLIPTEFFDGLTPKLPATVKVLFKPELHHGKSEDVQLQTYSWILDELKMGKTVSRLKSGDPFLYGRGGEEVNHFRKLGYNIEVIPGISSALCAPLVANIPVTHRGASNQLLISTGRGEKASFPNLPDYDEKRTLVFLMGVRECVKVATELIKKGYPPDLPIAVVEKATMKGERVVRGDVGRLEEMVRNCNIQAPATFIVGHVVNACVG